MFLFLHNLYSQVGAQIYTPEIKHGPPPAAARKPGQGHFPTLGLERQQQDLHSLPSMTVSMTISLKTPMPREDQRKKHGHVVQLSPDHLEILLMLNLEDRGSIF